MTQTADAAILSIVAALAPDRMAPVTEAARLVDDLGYDSPRQMELVVALENHLQTQLKDPQQHIDTVHDVIAWVNANLNPHA